MYRWIRTAKIANGRFPQAIGWAKEMTGFAQKKFKTPEINLYVTAIGEQGVVRWECEYPDLATFERVQAAVLTDSEYWQYIARANQEQLFVDGYTHDTLLRKV